MTYKGIGECRAITLTTGTDNITGTSGNDTISAVYDRDGATVGTLNLSDAINGGAGTDTFSVRITDSNGSVTYQHDSTPVRQVISEETSATVRECLEYVVASGTGKNGQVAGYRIGGKTGTADKGQSGDVVVSFLCFAPADDPQVIMLDEPTAALGVAQTAEVLNLIERVRERGLGVIIISHNMEDVRAVADRIVVLRLGKNNGVFSPDASNHELVAAITGATENSVSRRAGRKAVEQAEIGGSPA